MLKTGNLMVQGCTVTHGVCSAPRRDLVQARDQIMTYPLPQVEYRLEIESRVPDDIRATAIEEWRKFMVVALHSENGVGMISPVIDEVWHAFILFTSDYARFCQECFGYFVGHAPNWPGAPIPAEGGVVFVEKYEELFGQLPAIWTAHQDSACYIDGPECTVDPKCDTDDCRTQGCASGGDCST